MHIEKEQTRDRIAQPFGAHAKLVMAPIIAYSQHSTLSIQIGLFIRVNRHYPIILTFWAGRTEGP